MGKRARTVDVAKGVSDGKVWVSVGVKFSVNYCTRDFTVGLETPIQEGEDDHDALVRTHARVLGFFDANCEQSLDMLGNQIERAKNA